MERDLSGTETEELIAKINDELVEMTKIDDRNFELTVAFAPRFSLLARKSLTRNNQKIWNFLIES